MQTERGTGPRLVGMPIAHIIQAITGFHRSLTDATVGVGMRLMRAEQALALTAHCSAVHAGKSMLGWTAGDLLRWVRNRTSTDSSRLPIED